MGCSYSLKIGNTIKQYTTYADLFQDLINNRINIEFGQLSDIVFSEDVKQSEVVTYIKKIRSDAKMARGDYNVTSVEVDEKPESSDSMSVSDFIEQGKRADGNGFITHFDEVDYKSSKLNQLLEQKVDRAEAVTQIKETLEGWHKIADTAYDLHAVINQFFRGVTSSDGLQSILGDKFDPAIIGQLTAELHKVRQDIIKTHGSDVVLIPNVVLSSDIVGSDKKLIGSIDLIAVDSKGIPHIYLFKASSKQDVSQADVKKLKRDYQLAFYRHMLAAKGLNVSKSSLNIVPIELIGMPEGELEQVLFDKPVDRTVITKRDGTNNLQWLHGKLYHDANNIIDIKLEDTIPQGSIKDATLGLLSKMFPNKEIKITRNSASIDNFIKSKRVTDSDDSSKGRWMFHDELLDRDVYIRSTAPKLENAEVREKVEQYLERKSSQSDAKSAQFVQNIEKAIEGKIDLNELVSNVTGVGFINVHFGKYCNSDWRTVDIPALSELGILTIQNATTNQVDFIVLSNQFGLNDRINLGLGKTLLGSFKKDRDALTDDWLLPATNGNIDIMRVMCALNQLSDVLKDPIQVGEIKSVNLGTGEATIAQPKQIRHSFSALTKEASIPNKINDINWMSDLEILRGTLTSILGNNLVSNETPIKSMFAQLETLDPFNKDAILNVLKPMTQYLEKTYKFLSKGYSQGLKDTRTRGESAILDLYVQMWKTIHYIGANPFHQLDDVPVIGTISNKNFMNGRLVSTPDTFIDRNLLDLSGLVRRTFVQMRDVFSNFQEPFLQKTVKGFWASKGYSQGSNIAVGNQSKLYNNLYRRNPDGSLNDQMLFKNPYVADTSMDDGEKTFLKEVLWIINKERFNLHGKSEGSNEVIELKKTNKWFWVPLQQADLASKMGQTGVASMFKQEMDEVLVGIKKAKKVFSRDSEGTYTEEESHSLRKHSANYEILNRYSFSEADSDSRLKLLDSQKSDFWELNVENIVLQYKGAYIRKKLLDNVLPIAKGLRILSEAYSEQTGVDNENMIKTLDNYLKIAVFNQSILSDEEKAYAGYVGTVKTFASVLAVAGNIIAPIRDILEGQWKTLGNFISDYWGENRGFGKKDYMKAMSLIMSDGADTMKNVTLIEAMNQRFGIANMDINLLAQRAKSSKTGIYNFKDKLFWTSTCGDYFNRMSILIAKMVHDNCFDACSFDDNGFKYDWKKDGRFSAYANNQITSPEYGAQKGAYLSMLKAFNDQGYSLKDGDALPSPYTPEEIITIKSFSDRMYGYYDHDIRMQAEKTLLGTLMMQFSTYLTSAKTVWFLKPGAYDQGIKRQAIDDKTGKPLFWKDDLDADGNTIHILTTEDTGEPYTVTGKGYMEGIFWTLNEAFDDFKKGGIKELWKNWKETPVKMQNMKLLAFQIGMATLIAGITKYLLGLWKDNKKSDLSPYTIGRAMEDQAFNMVSKSLTGSMANFDIVSTFGSIADTEPPSIGIMSNFFTSTGGVMFGDKTFGSWAKTNFGIYRSFGGLVEGVGKIGAATENTIKEAKPE